MQQILGITLKWFQTRLVHSIIADNVLIKWIWELKMTFTPFVGKNEIQVTVCFGHVHDIVIGRVILGTLLDCS